MVWAWRNNVTDLDEDNINEYLKLHDEFLIFDGSSFTGRESTGAITDYNSANFNYAITFNTSDHERVTRIEFYVNADGNGSDISITLTGSCHGFLLAGVDGEPIVSHTMPREFLPSTGYARVSIPLYTTELSTGTDYYILINKNGDNTDHFHLLGSATRADTEVHPAYNRIMPTSSWALLDGPIYFTVYDGDDGVPVHENFATNGWTHSTWSSGLLQKEFVSLPTSDNVGNLRKIITHEYSSDDVWFRCISSTSM